MGSFLTVGLLKSPMNWLFVALIFLTVLFVYHQITAKSATEN